MVTDGATNHVPTELDPTPRSAPVCKIAPGIFSRTSYNNHKRHHSLNPRGLPLRITWISILLNGFWKIFASPGLLGTSPHIPMWDILPIPQFGILKTFHAWVIIPGTENRGPRVYYFSFDDLGFCRTHEKLVYTLDVWKRLICYLLENW